MSCQLRKGAICPYTSVRLRANQRPEALKSYGLVFRRALTLRSALAEICPLGSGGRFVEELLHRLGVVLAEELPSGLGREAPDAAVRVVDLDPVDVSVAPRSGAFFQIFGSCDSVHETGPLFLRVQLILASAQLARDDPDVGCCLFQIVGAKLLAHLGL